MTRSPSLLILVVGCLSGLLLAANGTEPVEVVRVYGAEGPALAVTEAAAAFTRSTGLNVEVVSGPPDEWLDRAAEDADVVFASAEFMMARFVNNPRLGLDPSSVVALYLRPSAILVRPGNPRRIEDFPDLLRSGIGVMVVDGSGQTGLWEDMAGRSCDPRLLQRLADNIVVHAETSTEACARWRDRPDVDAWITWNIWQKPLRTEADIVHVSQPYRIYRRSSVALTARGAASSAAQAFVAYLQSAAGTEIFRSWNWMTADEVEAAGR